MSIPDCTLVTANFYFDDATRPLDTCFNNMKILLDVPCYMVIFVNSPMFDLVHTYRIERGLLNLTKCICIEPSGLATFPYHDQVVENRETYWPTRDTRAGVFSHLITCNKFSFVMQAMDENPFGTSKFGWIDSNLGKNGTKISHTFSHHLLLYILQNVTEKFHIQILNVCDKKYKNNYKEYYMQYQWVVCGCLFTLGRGMRHILEDLHTEFINTTNEGTGHGEEMLYLKILDTHYNDISRGYGDYRDILHNFLSPTVNIKSVYSIIQKYNSFGYHKEAYDCCNAVLKQYDQFLIPLDYAHYAKVLFQHYLAAYYYKKNEAAGIVKRYKELVQRNPYFSIEYEKQKDFIDTQFAFIKI